MNSSDNSKANIPNNELPKLAIQDIREIANDLINNTYHHNGTSDFYSHDETDYHSSSNSSCSSPLSFNSASLSTSRSSFSCCSLCSCSTCYVSEQYDETSPFSTTTSSSTSDITNVSPLAPHSLSPIAIDFKRQLTASPSSALDIERLLKALKRIDSNSLNKGQNGTTLQHKSSPIKRARSVFKVLKPCCKHSLPKHLVHFIARGKFIKFVNSHYYTNSVLLRFNAQKCVHAKHNAKLFAKTARRIASYRQAADAPRSPPHPSTTFKKNPAGFKQSQQAQLENGSVGKVVSLGHRSPATTRASKGARISDQPPRSKCNLLSSNSAAPHSD